MRKHGYVSDYKDDQQQERLGLVGVERKIKKREL